MSEASHTNASFQLILETAEQLIHEKGCRQTTLQDIIDHSGLSKGAIYHYVSGKDELFGLILKSKMELANDRFQDAVDDPATQDAASPIQTIAQSMLRATGSEDVSNKIFLYLLSQMDKPKVALILQELYTYSLGTAKRWIEVGQRHGALPPEIEAARMASIFMVFTYGLRVHRTLNAGHDELDVNDLFQVLFRSLKL